MKTLRPAPASPAPPLVLFPPVTGETACYVEVADEIHDRAVFALEGRTDHATAEALARAYLEEIDAVTRAPVVLVGWSAGGVLAYEAARQAAAAGRAIAGVGLVEVRAPTDVMLDPLLDGDVADVDTVAPLVARLAFLAEEARPRYTKPEIAAMTRDERIATVQREAVRTGFSPPDADVRELLARFRVLGHAVRAYRPGPYPHRLTLFEVTDSLPAHPRPPTLGWEPYAPDRESISIEGNVFTALHPRRRAAFGRVLARWLGYRPG